MTMILKPGILVSLKTTLHGGVDYRRVDLASERAVDGAAVERWETTKVVADPAEYERASKVRSAAGARIRAVCAPTAFGLLCPQDREAELDAAVSEARAMVDEHNRSAGCSQVHVYALKGRIASTDEEAARAIASDVRDLLDAMQSGIKRADPKSIREAANKARQIGAILGAEQQEMVGKAVDAARSAARAIVKRVEKDGQEAALVIQELTTAPIERARFAFLDVDGPANVGPALPAINVQRFAELGDDDEETPAPAAVEPSEPGETLAAASS